MAQCVPLRVPDTRCANRQVRLQLDYDTSKWEEYALFVCLAVLFFLSWQPCLELTTFNGQANVFTLRHETIFRWPRLTIAATLAAISQIEMVEDKVLRLRVGDSAAHFSGVQSHSEYGLRLFLLRPEACTGRSLQEIQLGFGLRSTDPALMKRIVEV